MADALDAGPLFPGRLLVIATTEFQGRRLTAQQMVNEAVWQQSTDIQDEVRRMLKRALADEILQVIDPQFTVTR